MRLGYVVHYVEDVVKTVAFYEAAFGLICKRVLMDNRYAEMETGTTLLAFSQEDLMAKDDPDLRLNRADQLPGAAEIAFFTDDVPAAYERAIKAGATEHVPPRPHDDGQWMAHLRDINGCLVELCTPPQ